MRRTLVACGATGNALEVRLASHAAAPDRIVSPRARCALADFVHDNDRWAQHLISSTVRKVCPVEPASMR